MNRHVLPVSVIIATRNRPALLADTVRSVGAGDAIPAELIVVDQSDTPTQGGWQLPLEVSLRYLTRHAGGLSAARNAGAAEARHSLLVFTDDDMQADRQWLGALVAELVAAGPDAVVTGRVLAGAAERPDGFVPATVTQSDPATYSGRLRVDVLAGGNMAIGRDAFAAVGGFDERLGPGRDFPAAEDNDLGYRLLESGFRVIYTPDALLIHRAWRDAGEYLPLRFAYGRGKGGFYMKHARLSDLHLARRMGRDLLRRATRSVRLAHHPRWAVGELAYAAGVIAGAAAWLARHRGVAPAAGDTRS